eukprot:6446401-Lingulodinium_polyedra.AAC.1
MTTHALVAHSFAGWIACLGWMCSQGACMRCAMYARAAVEETATLEPQVYHGAPEEVVVAACAGARRPGGP